MAKKKAEPHLQIDVLDPDAVFVKAKHDTTGMDGTALSYAPRFLKTKGKRMAQHHGPGLRVVTTDEAGNAVVIGTAKLQVNVSHDANGNPEVSFDILQFED